MRRLISSAFLIALLAGTALPATAAKRVALVIGNSAYQNAPALPNPINDGRALADVLRRLDFVVIDAMDQDKAGMQKLLRQFSAELQDADTSLFFYAGHGLQVQGQNYLVPIDAALESEVDLPFEAVSVDVVLDLMEQTTPLRLVFLDACRDNPLARRLAISAPSRSLGVGRGLARMNNRVGTLIAFATEPDKVALDGDGEHSPFTRALLEHIETPGIEVRQMLSRVRATVINDTNGEQLPLDTSALVEDFYFAPIAPAVLTPTEPAAPVPAVASTEQLFWQSIQASTDPNDFSAYLESYPDGAFAPLARNRLNALAAPPETAVAALTPPTETPPAAPPPPVAEIVEVEPLDTTLVATRNVNVRGAPNTDGAPLGVVAEGTEVAVIGSVVGGDWYQIRRPDGSEAYVYAPLFVSPEALAAAAPEPVPAPEPATIQEQAATPPPSAEPPQAPAPAEAAEMAAVTPGVAGSGRATATRASPVPAPHLDIAALLQSLGERERNTRFQFTYQIKGERGRDFVGFDQWEEVGSDDAPRLIAGTAAETRIQRSSETFGEALLATEVTPEMFGVLMYSRLTSGGRSTFMAHPVSRALTQWTFLNRHGARVEGTSGTVFEGVQFELAALTLNEGAPAQSCLGFVGYQVGKRVDGFVCRPGGPAFDLAQASTVLSQIHVPRFIEP
jgi:hypothetical protein